MTPFKEFSQFWGTPTNCRKAEGGVIEKYRDTMPNQLIEHWVDEGWCGYANGLFWVTNPDDFSNIPQDWLKETSQDAVVIARTAFADLFLLANGRIYFLSVHYGWSKFITDDVEIFFEGVLCDSEYVDEGLDKKLFAQALPKLGALEQDECYGFFPALKLGGAEKLSSLKKVKIREHLAFLAQIL